jgi:hypothetical protein
MAASRSLTNAAWLRRTAGERVRLVRCASHVAARNVTRSQRGERLRARVREAALIEVGRAPRKAARQGGAPAVEAPPRRIV